MTCATPWRPAAPGPHSRSAPRYRIDLVAMHPARPGRPVLAIECDGAADHASATARDRDRLRQARLHRLGWRLVRIWSTDWFYGREQATERVLAADHEAVRVADLMGLETPDAAVARCIESDSLGRERPEQ